MPVGNVNLPAANCMSHSRERHSSGRPARQLSYYYSLEKQRSRVVAKKWKEMMGVRDYRW